MNFFVGDLPGGRVGESVGNVLGMRDGDTEGAIEGAMMGAWEGLVDVVGRPVEGAGVGGGTASPRTI